MIAKTLPQLLDETAALHSHLCPRQVLGARIGLAGAAVLALAIPRSDKRLLVILETDGCFADGVEVATGATAGHRTLRIEDYGKIAATFVDTKMEKAVRVAPRFDVRDRSWAYAPEEKKKYFAQLRAYQVMPDEELLSIQEVRLTTSIDAILSRPGVRTICAFCGEEIINEREVIQMGIAYCRACAGRAYYQLDVQPVGVEITAPALAE